MLYNPRAVQWLLPIIEVLASFVGTMINVNIAIPKNERQQTITRVSTISCVESCIIQGLRYGFYLKLKYWPPLQTISSMLLSLHQTMNINRVSTECQYSINHFGCCILYNPRAILRHLPINNIMAANIGKWEGDMVIAPVWKWASTERQRLWVLHVVSSKGCGTAYIHYRGIVRLYRQYGWCW